MTTFASVLPDVVDALAASLRARTGDLQDTTIYDGPRHQADVPDNAILLGQPQLEQEVVSTVMAEGAGFRYREEIVLPVTVTSRSGDTDLSARRRAAAALLGHLTAAVAEDLDELLADAVVGPTVTWRQAQTDTGSWALVDLLITGTGP